MDTIINAPELKVLRLVLSRWQVNSYIVICPVTGASAIIDAPPEANEIIRNLEGTSPQYVLLTHGHIDHVAGLGGVQNQVKAPLAAHSGDSDRIPSKANLQLNDGDLLQVGNVRLKVIHTPGHTPGSICFLSQNYLLSGDTLFPGGPGRTDSPEDFQFIKQSISKKLLVLAEETRVFPGHGEFTTIKKAREEYAVFTSRQHAPGLCGDVSWLTS